MIWAALIAVAALYLAVVVFMYAFQGRLMYPGSGPSDAPPTYATSGAPVGAQPGGPAAGPSGAQPGGPPAYTG